VCAVCVRSSAGSLHALIPSACAQIYAIYDYQVAFNVRLATEDPYVPTFGADIPGGPPGLGVSLPMGHSTCSTCCQQAVPADRRFLLQRLTSAPAMHQQVDYVNAATPSPPVVTAKVMTGAPVTTSGVKVDAPMDLTGLYTVPVKITNTTRTKVRHR
jgi:hypothetical protein